MIVELSEREFASTIGLHSDASRSRSREVTLEEVDGRSLPARIRDGLAWLLTPHLEF
jgi:cardiolipin synthase